MSATLSHSAAPNGLGTITPYLTCARAAEAIAFYKKAFGASEVMRLGGPDGKIMHACLAIYGSHIFLSDEFPDFGNLSPKSLNGTSVSIHIFVDDADAAIAKAAAAGAEVIMPAADMFWGDRFGMVTDPFGHKWSLAKHLRDMTADEIHAAMARAAVFNQTSGG